MEHIDPYGHSRTLVHYLFQANPERIACMPNKTEFTAQVPQLICHRSNAKEAVTCYACKKTESYKNG